MAVSRNIEIKINADVSAFRSALNEATRDAKKAAEGMESVGRSASKAGAAAAGIDRVSRSTVRLGGAAGEALRQIDGWHSKISLGEVQASSTRLERLTRSVVENGAAWTRVGTTLGVAGVALGTMSVAAARTGAQFDATMSRVKVNAGVSGRAFEMLRDAALEAGKTTVFTASEAADGMDQLAKAGVSASDILGGALKGALDLAAAGEMSVADAAETAATALTQFHLDGSKIPHVADLLAKGASAAQGDVKDLAFAMRQGGLVASQMGLSIEDTVGTLTAFASAGMIGSDAGTSLRTMMMHLMSPTKKVSEMMDDLGLSLYDSNGQFVGMEELAGRLQSRLGGLTDAQRDQTLATMFGMDAIRGANILYDLGAEGVRKWKDEVNDSGFAARSAAARLDNLQGDLRLLKSAWENAQIMSSRGMNNLFRPAVQGVTEAVRAFSSLPPSVQSAIGVMIPVGAVALTAGGAFMRAAPRVVEFRNALKELGIVSKTSSGLLGSLGAKIGAFAKTPAGIAAGVATAGAAILGAVTAAGGAMKETGFITEEAVNRLHQLDKAGGDAAKSIAFEFDASSMSAKDFGDSLRRIADPSLWQSIVDGALSLGDDFAAAISFGHWDDRTDLQKMKDDLESYGNALSSIAQTDFSEAVDTFNQLAAMTDGSSDSVYNLIETMPAFKDQLIAVANDAGIAADKANLVGLATGYIQPPSSKVSKAIAQIGYTSATAEEQIDSMVNSFVKLANRTLKARSAQRDFNDAVSSAYDVLKDASRTSDDVQAALDGIASAGLNVVSTLKDKALKDGFLSESEQASMVERVNQTADAMREFGRAAGIPSEQVEELINELGLLPESVTVPIEAQVETFLNEIDGVRIEATNDPATIQVDGNNEPAKESIAEILDLPAHEDGTITINGETLPAQLSFFDLVGLVEDTPGTFKFTASDGTEVTAKAESIRAEISKKTGKIRVAAVDEATGETKVIITDVKEMLANNPALLRARAEVDPNYASDIRGQLDSALSSLGVVKAPLSFSANPDEAKQAVDLFRKYVSGQTVEQPVDVDTNPAMEGVQSIKDSASTGATMPLDADPSLANGVIGETQANASTNQFFFLNADPSEANAIIAGVQSRAQQKQTFTWDTDPSLANSKVAQGQTNARKTNSFTWTATDDASWRVKNWVNALPKSHTITVTTMFQQKGVPYSNNVPAQGGSSGRGWGFASGGEIYGPGSGTSDSIPAWLSNGEHVLTAAEVKAAGGQDAVYRMRALIRAGALKFADGGSPSSYVKAVPPVKVNSVAPVANVTVVVDNPLTGEQIRHVAESVADGRIVRAARLGR